MTHGSLFSGIGGFDLAADWMGWENVFYCEKEQDKLEFLKKRFKESEIDKQFEKLKNFKIADNEENKEILAKYNEPLEAGTNALLLLKRPNINYKILKELKLIIRLSTG